MIFGWGDKPADRLADRLAERVALLEQEVAQLTRAITALTAGARAAPVGGPLDLPLAIAYRDSGGQTSRRTVTVHEVVGHVNAAGQTEVTAIKGYCHLRKTARTFLLARVSDAIDPATGEVIADLRGWLAAHS